MPEEDVDIVDPGWPWARGATFVPAVRTGGIIYVSGQLALDPDGALIGRGNMEAQTRRIFAAIDEILRAAGATLADVIRLTCYCTDLTDYAAYSRVRGEVFVARLPASTTVGVSNFLVPGALLEVDALAIDRRFSHRKFQMGSH